MKMYKPESGRFLLTFSRKYEKVVFLMLRYVPNSSPKHETNNKIAA